MLHAWRAATAVVVSGSKLSSFMQLLKHPPFSSAHPLVFSHPLLQLPHLPPILKRSVSKVHGSQVHLPSGGWRCGYERERETERESECDCARGTSSVKDCGTSSAASQHENKRAEEK